MTTVVVNRTACLFESLRLSSALALSTLCILFQDHAHIPTTIFHNVRRVRVQASQCVARACRRSTTLGGLQDRAGRMQVPGLRLTGCITSQRGTRQLMCILPALPFCDAEPEIATSNVSTMSRTVRNEWVYSPQVGER